MTRCKAAVELGVVYWELDQFWSETGICHE